MNLVEKPSDCCGCTACRWSCPKGAITMQPDAQGFLYPQIDPILCIDCGVCRRVCAFQQGGAQAESFEKPLAYGANHKDEQVRARSSSGGAFTAAADAILRMGGVVYGVYADNEWSIRYGRAEDARQCRQFCGSKYVQSDAGDAFVQVKANLDTGKTVLFTGTPCYVAGLQSFLGKEYKDLYTVDVICHGAPSPLLWKEFLRYIEQWRGDRIKAYDFRSKVRGWHHPTELAIFENKPLSFPTQETEVHLHTFLDRYTHRMACYYCPYANTKRQADITLADFWGIEDSSVADMHDDKGTSLVLVNTEKGTALFDKMQADMVVRQCSLADGMQDNVRRKPAPPPSVREDFWQAYQDHGYAWVVQRYGRLGIKHRLWNAKPVFHLKNALRRVPLLAKLRRERVRARGH